jgi:general secretion pathway protein F
LPLALERLAASLARAQRLRETIRSALVYPAVLLVLASASIVIVLTVIVPEFRPMLEDAHVHLA